MDPIQPTSNIPVQPTQDQFIPSSSKSVNKLFFVIGGFIILFVGLFGGYYLIKSSSKPPIKGCTLEAKICPDGSSVSRIGPNCEFSPCPQVLTSPTPTPNLINESSQSATTNWNTYSNQLFNYEFKYPINWAVKNMGPDSGWGEANSNSHFVGIIRQGYENNYPLYHMSIEPIKNLLVENVEKDEEKAYQNWISTYRGYSLEGKIESQKTVNNITMNIIEGTSQYSGKVTISLYQKIYLFKTADRKSSIAILIWSANKKESDIFDQILSTFKFIDSASTSNAQNISWINKKIDLYNLEVTIPADWSFIEVNRRPEPSADYMVKRGHDCADYELKSNDNYAILSLKPVCGYGDGGVAIVPSDAVTVKKLPNNSEIIRVFSDPPGDYVYGKSGYADISDLNGTRREKNYVNVINLGDGQNSIDIYNSLKITSPENLKQRYLDISDKIVSSLTLK